MKTLRARLLSIDTFIVEEMMQHREEHRCGGVRCKDYDELVEVYSAVGSRLLRMKKERDRESRRIRATRETEADQATKFSNGALLCQACELTVATEVRSYTGGGGIDYVCLACADANDQPEAR